MKTNTMTKLALSLLAVYGLSACNIDVSMDEQTRADLNKTATGVIQSVEEFLVNNEKYDISNASITMDGVPADKTQLKEGMVVSVASVQGPDGNQALSIDYADVTEGVVLNNNIANSNTMDVLGQTVHIDQDTVFDAGSSSYQSINDVNDGSVVEVSGYTSGNGEVWATRVEVKNTDFLLGEEIEVKGLVSNLNGNRFSIGSLTVDYDLTNVEYYLNAPLENGMYVEVESVEGIDTDGILIASEVKLLNAGRLEVRHDDNDHEVEMEGVLTQLVNGTQLRVNGSLVQVTADTRFENGSPLMLAEGIRLEVEGSMSSDNTLVVSKIEFKNRTQSNRDNDDGDSDSDHDSDESEQELNESGDQDDHDRDDD